MKRMKMSKFKKTYRVLSEATRRTLTDVLGSYTASPINSEIPTQDADDL